MSDLQHSREVEVFSPLGENVLLLQHMTATEALGRLFEFELNLLSEQPDIQLQDLLGQPMTVRLTLPDDQIRYFNGFVSRATQVGMFGNYHAYQVSLRPWFWFLTRTADCRIFQEMTVPDIIKQMFRDHGFSDVEDLLSEEYRNWEYCVQYRETDFNFISRLMEQEGIYYYFKHEEDKHTLVLSDSIESHKPVVGYEEVPYYPPQEQARREREHIYDWLIAHEVQPSAYALNDFNFKTPKANLQVNLSSTVEYALSNLEVFDYPGEYVERDEGVTYVRRRVEEVDAQFEVLQGQSNTRGFFAGGMFEMTNFPREDQNREYLIVSAMHNLQSGQYESGGETGAGTTFSCNFSVIDSNQPYRHPRTTPKPVVQGPQTAIVVGPAGQEIHTDEYGRVKVQFHWDRHGQADENSSCWIRVSHPTAGKNWGAVAIPRIGQEVIVDFLEGDPDRPIITGRVYNADEMPPFDLPNNGMVSGMKSNSTPGGGGYNEISMNDTKGEENVTIHAQYNMDTVVENDQSSTVHNNRTTTVDVDDSETVSNNQTLTVGSNQTLDVGSNQTITIGGERSVNVGSSDSLTVGSARTMSVGSSESVTISGSRSMTVGGSEVVNVSGDQNTTATNINDTAGANVTIAAGANAQVTGAANVTITAGSALTLTAGGSSIVINAGGITLSTGGVITESASLLKHNV